MNYARFSRFFAALAVSTAMLVAVAVAKDTQSSVAVTPAARQDAWWQQRHESMNTRVKQGNVDLILIGDSITHGWEGEGKDVWAKFYGPRNAVNLGIGGDQTPAVNRRPSVGKGTILGVNGGSKSQRPEKHQHRFQNTHFRALIHGRNQPF